MSPTKHVKNATLLAWVGTALLAVQLDYGPLIPREDRSQTDHTKGLKNRSHVGLGLGTDLIVIVSHCLC